MKYEKILHITTLTLAYLPTLIFQGQETITVDRVNAGLGCILSYLLYLHFPNCNAYLTQLIDKLPEKNKEAVNDGRLIVRL